jgi:hypothetical protein
MRNRHVVHSSTHPEGESAAAAEAEQPDRRRGPKREKHDKYVMNLDHHQKRLLLAVLFAVVVFLSLVFQLTRLDTDYNSAGNSNSALAGSIQRLASNRHILHPPEQIPVLEPHRP